MPPPDPPADPRRGHARPSSRWVACGVTLLPVSAALILTWTCGLDHPFVDDWNRVEIIGRAQTGDLTFADLWVLENGHRTFVPKLVSTQLSRATSWDLRAEMLVSLACAAISLLLIGSLLWRKGPWLLPMAAMFLFSLHSWRNWTWGIQTNVALSNLCVCAAIVLLSGRSVTARRLALASTAAVLASWSFLSGFLVWPVGGFILVVRSTPGWRPRLRYCAVWVLVGTLTVVAHWAPYPPAKPAVRLPIAPNPASQQMSTATDPAAMGPVATPFAPPPDESDVTPSRVAEFVTRYFATGLIGRFDGGAHIALGAVGLLGLAISIAWLVVMRRSRPGVIGIAALGIFSVGCGVAIAMGRIPTSALSHAMASRYTAFSGLGWIVLLATVHSALRHRLGRLTMVAAVTAFLATTPSSVDDARQHASRLSRARDAMRCGSPLTWEVLNGTLGNPIHFLPRLGNRLELLRTQRLSFLADAPTERLASPDPISPLEMSLLEASVTRTAVHVAARVEGGVAGTVVGLCFVSGRESQYVSAAVFQPDGAAMVSARIPPPPAGDDLRLVAVSIDAAGRIVQSPLIDVAR